MKLYPEKEQYSQRNSAGWVGMVSGRGSNPPKNIEPLSSNMRWGTIAVCQMQCVADADLVTNGNNGINTTNSISRSKVEAVEMVCCGKPINTEADCEGFNRNTTYHHPYLQLRREGPAGLRVWIRMRFQSSFPHQRFSLHPGFISQ